MTQNEIRIIASACEVNISHWQCKLRDIQEHCKHPNATKKHGANTGNYDPSCDHYWIDWDCPDCTKRWTTPQGKQYDP